MPSSPPAWCYYIGTFLQAARQVYQGGNTEGHDNGLQLWNSLAHSLGSTGGCRDDVLAVLQPPHPNFPKRHPQSSGWHWQRVLRSQALDDLRLLWITLTRELNSSWGRRHCRQSSVSCASPSSQPSQTRWCQQKSRDNGPLNSRALAYSIIVKTPEGPTVCSAPASLRLVLVGISIPEDGESLPIDDKFLSLAPSDLWWVESWWNM